MAFTLLYLCQRRMLPSFIPLSTLYRIQLGKALGKYWIQIATHHSDALMPNISACNRATFYIQTRLSKTHLLSTVAHHVMCEEIL